MNRRYPDITPNQLTELRAYAADIGRGWKANLEKESWWRGLPARGRRRKEYPSLYGLRNSHGPSWLTSFRFPKEDNA